jgi:FixJ family two-component response regulator
MGVEMLQEFFSRRWKVSVAQTSVIAIVDDDQAIREAIESLLKSAGYGVELFASAEEFLNLGSRQETACLILDVRMPGMSGLELQSQLAAANCSIPIIFISAHSDERARARALKAGAIDFLQKPFSEESLLNAIDASLAIRRGGSFDGDEPEQPT